MGEAVGKAKVINVRTVYAALVERKELIEVLVLLLKVLGILKGKSYF